MSDGRALAAKKKSNRARRSRNKLIKKQTEIISKLKAKVACYKKRLQRLKQPAKLSPKTKVNQMVNLPSSRETIKNKLLFGKVLGEQLKENYSTLSNENEKRLFRRMISGKLVSMGFYRKRKQ